MNGFLDSQSAMPVVICAKTSIKIESSLKIIMSATSFSCFSSREKIGQACCRSSATRTTCTRSRANWAMAPSMPLAAATSSKIGSRPDEGPWAAESTFAAASDVHSAPSDSLLWAQSVNGGLWPNFADQPSALSYEFRSLRIQSTIRQRARGDPTAPRHGGSALVGAYNREGNKRWQSFCSRRTTHPKAPRGS